jgi:putative tryptophan/tyrosine transport system substrate-binding protein
MRRREFIRLLGSAAVAWPLAAHAQRPATQNRIAIFHPAIPTTHLTETGGGSAWRAFFAELRRLGYVEGENLIIERYSAEGHHEPPVCTENLIRVDGVAESLKLAE